MTGAGRGPLPCKGPEAMLERQAVECLGIVNGRKDGACPPILKILHDLLPDLNDDMISAAG